MFSPSGATTCGSHTGHWPNTPAFLIQHGSHKMVPLAQSQREHPTAFIENTDVFGDLATQPRFVEAYLWALNSLHRDGARATLETLIKESP